MSSILEDFYVRKSIVYKANIPNLLDILVPYTPKWTKIGAELGFTEQELRDIKSRSVLKDDVGYFTTMLNEWVLWTYNGPHHCRAYYHDLCHALASSKVGIGDNAGDVCLKILGNISSNHEDAEEDTIEKPNREESDNSENEDDDSVKLHFVAVEQAITEKGLLEHLIAHGVFAGPAGSGKSSLMARLVCDMPSSTSPSTGVASQAVQIEVKKSHSMAASVSNSSPTWLKILYNEEAVRLMAISSQRRVLESRQKKITALIAHWESRHHTSGKFASQSTTSNDVAHTDRTSPSPPSETTSVSSQKDEISDTEEIVTVSLPKGYTAPKGVLMKALRQGSYDKLCEHFKNSWSLYLTDTGGQMEFQEVLPLLVSGPSIFFITFRLDQDLNQRFTINYRLPEGGNSESYESTLTLKEAILQTLASIASMGVFTYKGAQEESAELKPKVLIIGTHKDMLEKSGNAQAKIKEIDQQLQKIIMSTSHYRKDLVKFASESQLIFTVNNFSEDESDFDKIRSSVEETVHSDHDHFTMKFPFHWLLFCLVLRQQMVEDQIISYEQCSAIANDCGIDSSDELNEVLWFLHTKIGLIRHFPQPGLSDIVIRDPQVLFDQVTQLIVNTFTFKNAEHRRSSEFKNKGIFTMEDFTRISCNSNPLFPPEKLLQLLESLHIIAQFQTDDGQTKYFFPCVLAHSVLLSPQISTDGINPSLLITFKCGYCPKGLVGALFVYLLTNQMPETRFKWKLKTEQVYRDQVSFLVSPYDTITLHIHLTFLELVHTRELIPQATHRSPISTVCSSVRQHVQQGIRKVLSTMSFTSNAKHSLSFYCSDSECTTRHGPHPATITKDGDEPCSLWCKKAGNTVFSTLPAGWPVWFGLVQHSQESEIKELGLESHSKVCQYLQDMENDQLKLLGGVLGLHYAKLQRMGNLPSDMVAAWLRREDKVRSSSWKSLVEALKEIGQTGIARNIESAELKPTAARSSLQ